MEPDAGNLVLGPAVPVGKLRGHFLAMPRRPTRSYPDIPRRSNAGSAQKDPEFTTGSAGPSTSLLRLNPDDPPREKRYKILPERQSPRAQGLDRGHRDSVFTNSFFSPIVDKLRLARLDYRAN